MAIDKAKLQKVIEAIFEAANYLQSELMVYQIAVQGLCEERGLDPQMIQELVDGVRKNAAPKIAAALAPQHLSLLEKLPRIIELLDSNQDALSELLKAWRPQDPIN